MVLVAPAGHRPIAPKSETVAGFLVGMQDRKRCGYVQAVERGHHLVGQHMALPAEGAQGPVEVAQALEPKVVVLAGGVGFAPQAGLDDVNAQQRPRLRGGTPRGVVHHAQWRLNHPTR